MNTMIPSITLHELKNLLEKDHEKVLLIDVRSKEEFETQHIPGSVNIPASELKELEQNSTERKTIVTICNHGGNRSQNAAQAFRDSGAKNSHYLEGGTAGWFDQETKVSSIH